MSVLLPIWFLQQLKISNIFLVQISLQCMHAQQTSFLMMMMTDLIIKQIKAYCGCLCAYDSSHARLFEKLNNRTTILYYWTELVCFCYLSIRRIKIHSTRNKIDSQPEHLEKNISWKINFNCFKNRSDLIQ